MRLRNLKKNWIPVSLILIFFLAAFLRLYKIHEVPVSLYWDEIASTYNAYSIAETGKDEYGTSFPLLFRSFDDYKMSGNIYLTAIMVKIFGLNEFAARASSALLGIATVVLTYFLVKELFSNGLKKGKSEYIIKASPVLIASISSLLLAISPWHIQFSRTGFEANSGLFFIVLGTLAFLKGVVRYKWFLLSMISYAVSLYFYRSIHVFLPIFLLGLFVIFRKELLVLGVKKVISGILLFTFVSLPLVPWMLSEGGMARVRQVNVISQAEDKVYENSVKRLQEGNNLISRVIYNRRLVYLKEISGNYLSHFSLQYLFLSGDDNGRHGPGEMGLLYLWELPIIVLGLVALIKFPGKIRNVILLWILISPIAASLSLPSPHALRTLNVLPMPYVIASLGILFAFFWISERWRKIYVSVLLSIAIISFFYYLHLYYNITAKATANDWADGYKQLTQYIFTHEKEYERVIVSGHYWQPYIYFLFYKSYDPLTFQTTGTSEQFDKYYFGGTGWDRDKGRQELGNVNLQGLTGTNDALVALSPEEYAMQKGKIRLLSEIKNNNNEIIFLVGDLRK